MFMVAQELTQQHDQKILLHPGMSNFDRMFNCFLFFFLKMALYTHLKFRTSKKYDCNYCINSYSVDR